MSSELPTLGFRVKAQMKNKLEAHAELLNVSPSKIARTALNHFLDQPRNQQVQMLALYDEDREADAFALGDDLTPEQVATNLERTARFIRRVVAK